MQKSFDDTEIKVLPTRNGGVRITGKMLLQILMGLTLIIIFGIERLVPLVTGNDPRADRLVAEEINVDLKPVTDMLAEMRRHNDREVEIHREQVNLLRDCAKKLSEIDRNMEEHRRHIE